jgi:hypothetical protein
MQRSMIAVLLVLACSTRDAPRSDRTVRSLFGICRISNGSVSCRNDDARGSPISGGSTLGTWTEIALSEDAIDIAVGALSDRACAVTVTGRVACWGVLAKDAQIVFPPRWIEGIEHAKQVAMGGSATCAVDASGRVLCWGDISSAMLAEEYSDTPIALPVQDAIAVAGELNQLCVLDRSGARCFGGRVPDSRGRQVDAIGLRPVPNTANAKALRARIGEICAAWADTSEKCWSTTWTNPAL